MSKIDEKYINALDTFTGALEEIVETLKEQQKSKIDAVNDFLKSPMENLVNVVSELKEVTEKGFSDIKLDNKKILENIQAIQIQSLEGTVDMTGIVDNLKEISDNIKISNSEKLTDMTNVADKLKEISDIIKSNGAENLENLKNLDTSSVSEKYTEILDTIVEGVKSISTNFDDIKVIIKQILDKIDETNKADVESTSITNDKLVAIIDDLKEISVDFAEIKDNNKKILEEIKSAKKEKESGMFDKIENPKNKNKIVDGIKTVILIAAGVLAVGMAFKLISGVDLLSVLAVSAGIYIMAEAFGRISAIKGLTLATVTSTALMLPIMAASLALSALFLKNFPTIRPAQGLAILLIGGALAGAAFALNKYMGEVSLTKLFKISLMLPMIAIALTLSGYILRGFPNFTLAQGLSILLIGGALGVATFLVLMAVKKLSPKALLMAPLIPLILPLIALGLVLASKILGGIEELSKEQVINIAKVGLSIGIAMASVAIALTFMRGVSWKEILMLPVMVPLVAFGILLASRILNKVEIIDEPKELLKTSAVIGLSILMFTPVLLVLNKIGIRQVLSGTAAIPLIALGLVFTSIVFQAFKPIKDPIKLASDSLAIGLSILAFALTVKLVGKMGFKGVLAGAAAIPLIALAIVATAYIFKLLPDEMKYPPVKWTLGAGLAVLGFGVSALLLGTIIMMTGGLGLAAIALGAVSMVLMAGSIVAVSAILAKGTYDKYPSLKWALGVSASLVAFSVAMVAATAAGIVGAVGSLFTGGENPMLKLADNMVLIAEKLNEFDWDTATHPTLKWTAGVGAALLSFSIATVGATAAGIVGAVGSLFTGGENPMVKLVDYMITVAEKLNEFDWDTATFPTLKWTAGVGAALLAFSISTVSASATGIVSAIGSLFTGGENPMVKMVENMILVGEKLNEFDWTTAKYPSKEYAEGVGILLKTLSRSFRDISKIEGKKRVDKDFGEFIEDAFEAIKTANEKLTNITWNEGNIPSEDYVKGIGGLLETLSVSFASISKTERGGFLGLFRKEDKSFSEFVEGSIGAIRSANDSLVGITWNEGNIPSEKYVKGIGGLLESLSISFGAIAKTERGGLLGLFRKEDKSFSEFVEGSFDAIKSANSSLIGVTWNEGNVPSEKYVKGIGGLLETLSISFATIAKIEGKKKLDADFKEFIVDAFEAMKTANEKLTNITWNLENIPSEDYVKGISSLLETLSKNFATIAKIEGKKKLDADFKTFIIESVEAIKTLNENLKGTVWDLKNVPNEKYTESIGSLLIKLSEAFSSLNRRGLKAISDDKDIFKNFVITASESMAESSQYLAKVDYNKIIDKRWVDSFSYFTKSMMDLGELDMGKVGDFSSSSDKIIPAIDKWLDSISKSDFSNIPSKDVTKNLINYLESIDKVVSDWESDKKISEEFSLSIEKILGSLLMVPDFDENVVTKMEYAKDSLKILDDSLKDFDANRKLTGISESVYTIASAMQILSLIKPVPGGVTQSFVDFLKNLESLPDVKIKDKNLEAIEKISASFSTLADSLMLVNTNLEKFVDLYKGISKIDAEGAEFKLIDNKQNINIINPVSGAEKTESGKEAVKTEQEEKGEKVINVSNVESDEQKRFYGDIAEIKGILSRIEENLDKPSQAPSFK